MAKTSGGVRTFGKGKYRSKQSIAIAIAEETIRRNKYETAVAYDSKGNLLLNKKGGSRTVRFTNSEIAKLKDSVFTHNHPSALGARGIMAIGTSFSHQDLTFAVGTNLKEIRAVTPTYTFSIKRPKNGWGVSPQQVKAAYNRAERAVKREMNKYLDKVGRTKTSYERANVSYYNQINKRVAKQFGWEYLHKRK